MTAKEARQIIRELVIAYQESRILYLPGEESKLNIIPTSIEWEAMARLVGYKL